MFRTNADERSRLVEDLRAEVRRLGGNPEDDQSTMGSLHQRWLDLKAAITGRDDKAIINEVERGEDYLKAKFQAALDSDDADRRKPRRRRARAISRCSKATTRSAASSTASKLRLKPFGGAGTAPAPPTGYMSTICQVDAFEGEGPQWPAFPAHRWCIVAARALRPGKFACRAQASHSIPAPCNR